jgi:ribosomal protein S15P/S13E
MLKKMETSEQTSQDERFKTRKKVETTLNQLEMLKNQISELRFHCEELKKLLSENHGRQLLCSECGDTIKPGQEVVVKDSNGIERSHYHKKCFRALLT